MNLHSQNFVSTFLNMKQWINTTNDVQLQILTNLKRARR